MRRVFHLLGASLALLAGSCLGLRVISSVASAHQVGVSRFEAPIPLGLLYAGAGITVGVTAVWLAVSSRVERPSEHRLHRSIPDRAVVVLRTSGRLGFFGVFVLAIVHGLVGPQEPAENLATVFVWPVWLKGVAIFAALAGNPWRVVSPWRTLYLALVRLEGGEIAVLGTYPERLGSWPALAGFLVWIGVLENLTLVPRSPATTTGLVAGYAAIMVLGAVAFGEAFLERADALAVLYRLFGRVAPLQLVDANDDWRVVLRTPWQGCTTPVADRAVAAFVIAAVYTVSFDGFASTPAYQTVLFGVRDVAGFGPRTGIGLYLLGFVLFLLAFAVVIRSTEAMGRGRESGAPLRAFAPTVLPIAVAYEIAHTYPFVASNVGRLLGILTRTVLGVPGHVSPVEWLSVPAFWTSQVLLIVAGHVVAVVAAHLVVSRRYETPSLARRAHVPLTALMIGYTILSLWIVSRPVVA